MFRVVALLNIFVTLVSSSPFAVTTGPIDFQSHEAETLQVSQTDLSEQPVSSDEDGAKSPLSANSVEEEVPDSGKWCTALIQEAAVYTPQIRLIRYFSEDEELFGISIPAQPKPPRAA